jgi:transposase-like protein
MVLELGKTRAQVARELEIHESLLGKWVTKAQGQSESTRGLPPGRLAELEAEVKKLRQENDFLKKAAAFFAKESTSS